jgi:hypothetical protein
LREWWNEVEEKERGVGARGPKKGGYVIQGGGMKSLSKTISEGEWSPRCYDGIEASSVAMERRDS